MTHRSEAIEVNEREAAALANAHEFIVVIKLGAGNEYRGRHQIFDQKEVESVCGVTGRGAAVYAIGKVGGLDVTVLAATYIPQRRKWKFAEGFNHGMEA